MRLRFSLYLRIFLPILGICVLYYIFKRTRPPLEKDFSSHINKLVDYHNYTLMKTERRRSGPGEHGKAVILVGAEKIRSGEVFTENGFCQIVSDKIALDRAIPDLRHMDCANKKYAAPLPTVSVIIPVFQEHWTTLLRTVVTLTRRAPPNVIKEVILVDDGSFKDFLKDKLDDYARTEWPPGFLRVVHHKQRAGLITARLTGAKIATGDVLLFLDSHIEAGTNYLPPLLDPIVKDYRTVVCPFIDVIDHDNFEYRAQDEGARGAFDWILNYKRLPRLPGDTKHPAEPFDSPVMAGGLFAISTKWFWELGGYDPGLQIWGGEQYELSFKLWMCGGRMVDVPCSRIGHIYRGRANFPDSGAGNFLARNYRRLMDVWMDEYGEYVLRRRPLYKKVDPGDITEQLAIRKNLQCKSFDWFMKNIAFDLTKKYPPEDPMPAATGTIHKASDKSYCIGTAIDDAITLSSCKDTKTSFDFTWREDITVDGTETCWDVPNTNHGSPIKRFDCHGSKGNQHFAIDWSSAGFDRNPVFLRHVPSNNCVTGDIAQMAVFLMPCDPVNVAQQWNWDTLQWRAAKDHEKRLNIVP